MILIGYDGSEDARAAIDHAGVLFGEQPATVLTVWQPLAALMSRASIGYGVLPAFPDSEEIDQASRKRAEQIAEGGTELAGKAGFRAEAASCAQEGTTAATILAWAEDLGASEIVLGSRGLTGVKSLLLGSVSHEVIQHADRAVVVVPSASVAASRSRQLGKQAATLR